MERILHLASHTSKPYLSKEQKALQSLMRVFKNTFEYRTKALMTTTDSALFKYFEDKRPPYRVLKGGKTAVIPVYNSEELWAILQIQSFKNIDKPTMDKVRNAIRDILLPALNTPKVNFKSHPCDKINIYLNCFHSGDGIKIALDVLDLSKKTCMIYWEALTPSPAKIGDLFDLQDTLIYVKEILALTPAQRNLFALYLNLPQKLRGAQVVFASSSSFADLKKLLHGESLFLEALQKHRVDIDVKYDSKQKDQILGTIIQSVQSETAFSHLI